MDIRIIIRIHELLNVERTGSPKELGLKLGICERSVFNYISYMKSELEAPIIYDSRKVTIPMKVDTLFRSKVDSCFADDFLG